MKVNSSRFGEIEIDEDMIFNFIEPIIGYEQLSKFAIIDNSPESPFKWLQSMEDGNIAFPITFPSLFGIDYEFVIPEDKSKDLKLKGTDSLITFNIVCIPQGQVQQTTVNLIGPIVANAENKTAMQLVLTNTKYTVKHKLFNDKETEKPKKTTVKEKSKQK